MRSCPRGSGPFLELGFVVFTGLPTRAALDLQGGLAVRLHPRDELRRAVRRALDRAGERSRLHLAAARSAHRQSLPRPGAGRAIVALPRQRDPWRTFDPGRRIRGGTRHSSRDPDAFEVAVAHTGAVPLHGRAHRARGERAPVELGCHASAADDSFQPAARFRPAASAAELAKRSTGRGAHSITCCVLRNSGCASCWVPANC